MKYFIQHPDATGRFDPPGFDVVRQAPGRVEKVEEADVIFVPFTRFDGFAFDEKLNDIAKPWVLFDYSEFGWDDSMEDSHEWGVSRTEHADFQTPALVQFDQFIHDHPPLLTFQRELLLKDCTEKLLPLDYLNWLPEHGNDPKDDFLKRPLEVSYNFGRSHEGRMWLHGVIFQMAGTFGFDVISDFSHLDKALKENGRKWLSVHVPHYARIDVREVQQINRKALVTLVMPGAGVKTFRTSECAGDGIMAMPRHRMACPYPWDETNSIVLPEIAFVEDAQQAVEALANALMRTDLYELYCNAMGNALNFRPAEYGRRWIAANVEKYL